MEKVSMPATVRVWLEAYVAENYREEPFRKRKRDKAKVEAYNFGHEPIVELRKRMRSSGGDNRDDDAGGFSLALGAAQGRSKERAAPGRG